MWGKHLRDDGRYRLDSGIRLPKSVIATKYNLA
jgi:hypothetical protein